MGMYLSCSLSRYLERMDEEVLFYVNCELWKFNPEPAVSGLGSIIPGRDPKFLRNSGCSPAGEMEDDSPIAAAGPGFQDRPPAEGARAREANSIRLTPDRACLLRALCWRQGTPPRGPSPVPTHWAGFCLSLVSCPRPLLKPC